jgi:hypothetical protein
MEQAAAEKNKFNDQHSRAHPQQRQSLWLQIENFI